MPNRGPNKETLRRKKGPLKMRPPVCTDSEPPETQVGGKTPKKKNFGGYSKRWKITPA